MIISEKEIIKMNLKCNNTFGNNFFKNFCQQNNFYSDFDFNNNGNSILKKMILEILVIIILKIILFKIIIM